MFGASLSTIPEGVDGQAALKEVRTQLAQIAICEEAIDEATASYIRSEHMLVRFLVAHSWNSRDAAEALQEHYSWLVQKRMSDLLADPFPEEKQIKRFYPQTFHGTDKLGRPIYIERIGSLDVKRLLAAVGTPRLLDYICASSQRQVCLRLPACSVARGEVIDTSLNILDLQGLSFGIVTNRDVRAVLKDILAIQQKHYPGLTGQTIIVNAPAVFSIAWAFAKPFLSEQLLSKIAIFGTSQEAYSKALLDLVDADQLPALLGGQCICDGKDPQSCMTCVKGPWTDSDVCATLQTKQLEQVMTPAGAAEAHDALVRRLSRGAAAGQELRQQLPNDKAPTEEAKPAEEAPVEEAKPPEEAPTEEAKPAEEAPLEEAKPVVEAPCEEAKPAEEAPTEEAKPAQEAPVEEAKPADEAPVEEAKPAEEVPTEEAKPAEEAPTEEAKPAEEAPVEEAKPSEEAPSEEAKPAEELPTEEAKPAEEAPIEEAKRAEEAPTEEAKPAEEAPTEEAKPAEEAPAEEAKPAEEAPVEEAKPAEEAPVEEAKPADEAPTEEAKPAEEAPTEEAKPAEEAPTDETKPAEETTEEAKPAEEAPTEEAKPAEEAPVEEAKPPEEAPTEEAKPAEEAPTEEAKPAEEAPIEEAKPAEEALTEEAKPAEEAPTEEAKPAEEAPIEEAKPAEEAPTEEAKPAEEVPIEEAKPAEEAPVEEAKPAEEAPAEEAKPVEEAPIEEAKPAEEAPTEESKPAELQHLLMEDAMLQAGITAEEAQLAMGLLQARSEMRQPPSQDAGGEASASDTGLKETAAGRQPWSKVAELGVSTVSSRLAEVAAWLRQSQEDLELETESLGSIGKEEVRGGAAKEEAAPTFSKYLSSALVPATNMNGRFPAVFSSGGTQADESWPFGWMRPFLCFGPRNRSTSMSRPAPATLFKTTADPDEI